MITSWRAHFPYAILYTHLSVKMIPCQGIPILTWGLKGGVSVVVMVVCFFLGGGETIMQVLPF